MFIARIFDDITYFQILSWLNFFSLVLSNVIIAVYNSVTKDNIKPVTGFIQYFKEEESATIIEGISGFLMYPLFTVFSMIITKGQGIQKYIEVYTLFISIIPLLDLLPTYIRLSIDKLIFWDDKLYLMDVYIQNIGIVCGINTILLITKTEKSLLQIITNDYSQIYKIIIIAFALVLTLLILFTFSNSLYIFISHVIQNIIQNNLSKKKEHTRFVLAKNVEYLHKKIADIDYDARMHPYITTKIISVFWMFYIVFKYKIIDVTYSIKLLFCSVSKEACKNNTAILCRNNYISFRRFIVRVLIIILLLAVNITLFIYEENNEVCAKIYEILSTVIIIPLVLDSINSTK